jgi:hypothetical protein
MERIKRELLKEGNSPGTVPGGKRKVDEDYPNRRKGIPGE